MQFTLEALAEEEMLYISKLIDILRGPDLAASYVIKNNIEAYHEKVSSEKTDEVRTPVILLKKECVYGRN